MAFTETRVGQLTRWTGRKGHLYVRTLHPETSPETRRRLGGIFGVIRATATDQVGEALAAHVEDAVIRGGAEAVRRLPAEATQEQVFEAAIARVNGTLTRLIEDGRLPLAPEQVAGALVSQNEREIVAAVWGDPSLLLFHPAKDGTKIFDLLDDGETDHYAAAKRGRGFTHLIAGQIGPGDKLVVATANLCDAFSPVKLAPIVVDNDPDQVGLILREILNQAHSQLSVALTVADCVEMQATANQPAKRLSSATQNSIEELLDTESRTKDILTASALQSAFRRVGAGLGRLMTKPAASTQAPRPNHADQPEIVVDEEPPTKPETGVRPGAVRIAAPPTAATTERQFAQKTAAPPVAAKPAGPSILTLAARSVANSASRAWGLLSSKESRWATWQSWKQAVDGGLTRVIDRYNALNGTSKGLLLAALLVLMAFNQSLAYAAWQRGQEDALARYDRAVAAIEQKMDSAQASQIYRDEERARQLLDEAAAAVTELPGRTAEQKTVQEQLLREIQDKRETARRAVKLSAPDVIATIVTDGVAPEIFRLLASGRTYWAVAKSGEVFKIDAASGAASRAGQAPDGASAFAAPMGDGIVVGANDGRLAQFTAAGKQYDKTADFSGFEINAADADSYLGRLYLLDARHNRVLRLNPTDAAFGRPQHYLKDATDVSSAVSLAVDGDVWLLLGDGSVLKLTRGERTAFVLGDIEPSLNAPRKLRTAAGSEALYVLNDAPGRLAVFDKTTGLLIAQLEADALTGASDFFMDEANEKLVVAVGNRLLRFNLPEFK